MPPSNAQLNLPIPALSAAWRDTLAFIAKTSREAMTFFTCLALFPWLSSPNWMYPLHFCLPFSSFIACLRASGACGLQVPLSLMLAFTYHFQKSLCLTHHQPLITSKVPQIILTRPLASDEDSSLVPQDACLGCRRWSLCWHSPCFMYSWTLSFLFLTLLLS